MPTTPRAADLKLTGLMGSLRCSQLFTGLSTEDLAQIAGFSLTLKLAKDDHLFHEGEVSRGFYLVQSGAVNVHRVSAARGVISRRGTKRVLAAELGTSSETLSRTLARLRDQQLITVGARTITVLAAPAFAAQLRRNLGEA